MRTLNSLKNVISNFANTLFFNILKFLSRIIFIKFLNDTYLGINGLLTNVLGLLALSELGISTAISYSLYKPLEENNQNKIKALMNFYKKTYFVIGIIILILGLILLPFLPWFIKDTTGIENLKLIYVIFLINMVIGYFFSYKRTLITADQKSYKITPILMLSNFLLTLTQIIVLILFRNYIEYLLVQTAFVIIENVLVNRYINKEYPYLKQINKNDKLEKKELSDIKTNIKALFFHKIGSYVFNSTDNLVISKFISIQMVGIYSNYYLIVYMVGAFISTITNNIVASLGNLLVSKNSEKKEQVFNEINFICFILYGFSTICLCALLQPFVELCFGENYLLTMVNVLLISFNSFIFGMTNVSITYMVASGLYVKDQYIPILQSIINIVVSVVLSLKIGLAGVLIGTLVSNILVFIIKPYIVYKYSLKRNVKFYFFDFFKKFLILLIIFVLTIPFVYFVHLNNLIICIIYRLVAILLIFCTIIYMVYRKNNTYRGVIERFKTVLFKKNIKNNNNL